jgi:hypothetical protein
MVFIDKSALLSLCPIKTSFHAKAIRTLQEDSANNSAGTMGQNSYPAFSDAITALRNVVAVCSQAIK